MPRSTSLGLLATTGTLQSQVYHEAARRAGLQVLILGCTELPLVLEHCAAYAINQYRVPLVDPTTLLARRCVALALERR